MQRYGRWILWTALWLAIALPLARFGQSLWSDEATSVWFARWPVSQLLTSLCDPHPPGYYLLLKSWMALGEQEWWLRWFSLAASVLAVALTYRLGRTAWRRSIGVLAALLLALHPLQTWYAAEARMYTMAEALGLVAFIFAWSLILDLNRKEGQFHRQIGLALAYGLATIIALGVDYTAIFPIILVQMVWLAKGHPRAKVWLGLQAGVLILAYLIWLGDAHRSALATSFQAFTLAVQVNRLGFDITPADATSMLRSGGILFIALGFILAWQWPKRLRGLVRSNWFLSLIVLFWVGMLLFTAVPRLYSFKRQLIAILPYITLAVAYALARLPRSVKILSLTAAAAVTLLVLPMHQRESWRQLLTDLSENEKPGVVWVDEWAVTPVDYYSRRLSEEGGAQLDWHPLLSRELPQLPAAQAQPDGSLWLIMAEGPYRNLSELLPPAFYAQYQLMETQQEPGIGIYHYQRRQSPLDPAPVLPAPSRTTLWSLESAFPLDACP